jgi:uncharacterized protein YhfF
MNTNEYWEEFRRSNPEIEEQNYQVWHFGNTAEMADELTELVLAGKKTATSSLPWEYDDKPEQAPTVGTYSVVTNFAGEPKCIVRTTEVRILPYNEVDAEVAFDEGDGDQSLAYWRGVHWDYFNTQCLEDGRVPDETMLVTCERFELVFPKS